MVVPESRRARPGRPGPSHEATRDFWAEMSDSGTGQAPTVFWSSFEATKVWLVSLRSVEDGEGGRGGEIQPWELRWDRRRARWDGEEEGQEGGAK